MDAKKKYRVYISQLSLIGYFTIILANASFYTQKEYNSFYIQPVLFFSFLLTMGYFLYRVSQEYNFFSFLIENLRHYSRRPLSRLIAILGLCSFIARFLLDAKIIFYIQNTFYIAAFIYLAIGIILFLVNRRK